MPAQPWSVLCSFMVLVVFYVLCCFSFFSLIGIVLYCNYPVTKSCVVRKNAWCLLLKRWSKTMSLNRLGYSKQFLLKIWLQLICQAQKIPFPWLANKCSNKEVCRLECFHFHCSFELPADDHRKDLLCKTHLWKLQTYEEKASWEEEKGDLKLTTFLRYIDTYKN